ncbi:hypothetical protein CONLIGDRAFT_627062 [Coniochaeta ligniaria NRRL 30616]|uniref:Ig-like domain-containing protein n=1 Tax=Coniochaeta ligniaria NRRL 30616 TaxID=1408157 RepID=A0A1J7K491_9PEZI|nr:hypothetical protein CONLIGDRAFT_627062 [Coniochaeta ligniaria NRRL 30616]
MQQSSPFPLACLAAIAFILILVYRTCSTRARVPQPQTPVDHDSPSSSVLYSRQSPQSPSKISINRPPQGEPSCGAYKERLHLDHNLAIRHPPLIWIPIPRLGPPPSSICGRKGSAVTLWPEDLSEGNGGTPECQRDGPSDLLSGVGEQFTTSVGRRLSWLVWNEGAVEDSDATGAYRC